MQFLVGLVAGILFCTFGRHIARRTGQVKTSPTAVRSPPVRDLKGWIDYDRPALPSLNRMERVDYFEKRVRLVVIHPMQRMLDSEIQPVPDSSALLIFGVALCCAIEAVGKFLNGGQGGNGDRFHAFLSTYMNGDFQTKTLGANTYGRVLWLYFRNGLAHGFCVCHGGFEGVEGEPYFIEKGGVLEINPYELFNDFVNGYEQYLTDLRATATGDQLFLHFDHVFSEVFIHGR